MKTEAIFPTILTQDHARFQRVTVRPTLTPDYDDESPDLKW